MSQIPNGIGEFIIGESPIGAQPFDWGKTLFSQYANSPVLTQLIDYFSQAVDASGTVDGWFDNVWNVDTAVGYGLDVWGRIVGLNTGRVLTVYPTKYLAFEEAMDLSGGNWGTGIWYSGEALTENVTLSDGAFRQLILAKAAANIWDGSIPGLNKILQALFPGQISYCTDNLDMTMTYTFAFALSPVQISIVFNSNVLPRPAGVLASVVQI
jgi:hypothetical protein